MSDYRGVDKLLHRLALGSPAVAEMSFSMDQMQCRPDPAEECGQHVYIAGLARAGTTILMRRIHETGAFRSLTYADMPFVLAPNLWRRMRRGETRHIKEAERKHGDGIMVTAESPEGLEEPFWRVFDGPAYITEDCLREHVPDQDVIARYRSYIAAILAGGSATRYLCKNNNNILRLPALQSAFPDSVILIPFRRPADHAASLMQQHRRFRDLHRKDPFSQDYMRWLVHHEFGMDHRPFFRSVDGNRAPDTLAYWVEQWIGVYTRVAETAPTNAVFVCYEDLCTEPAIWEGIAARLHLDAAASQPEYFKPSARQAQDSELPVELLRDADHLYDALRARRDRMC